MQTRMNILLADDDVESVVCLKEVFHDICPNARIYTAHSSADAIAIGSRVNFHLAMIDVDLSQQKGMYLAQTLKGLYPRLNLVFVTANERYAYEAHQLMASGYILKPWTREQIINQMEHLRYPLEEKEEAEKLVIQCFGNFEAFYKGEPLYFKRSKGKEILAYLVDKRGTSVSVDEMVRDLYEGGSEESNKYGVRSGLHALRDALSQVGMEQVLHHTRNCYAINQSAVECDYYKLLEESPEDICNYRGKYMVQYSWAEFSI